MTLGEKIRQARHCCGLSQEQLAEKMCVSRSAIAKWETDKGLPDVGNLKMLSRLLGVSVDHLLDEAEAAEEAVIRERYDLAAYGRGCKKVKKDRVVREKFPDAQIRPLLGRQDPGAVEKFTDHAFGCRSAASYGAPDFTGIIKHYDKEFYLVEKTGRQYLVTVTDTELLTRPLEKPQLSGSFFLDGWNFVKCNYELE